MLTNKDIGILAAISLNWILLIYLIYRVDAITPRPYKGYKPVHALYQKIGSTNLHILIDNNE